MTVKTIIQPLEEFNGWGAATAFLEDFAREKNVRRVLDIGGGANPMMGQDPDRQYQYDLVDIDPQELAKAASVYDRAICADAAGPVDQVLPAFGDVRYDFVFSHMLLEHVAAPDALHRNLAMLLEDGGYAIHLYPSSRCLPLLFNRYFPERLSLAVRNFAQPERAGDEMQRKFPAFYRNCGLTDSRISAYFQRHGFEVVEHRAFAGHGYYRRFPVVRSLEKMTRSIVVRNQIPWFCFNQLLLRKNPAGVH
jgi:SAM-dependent methyltransferase